MTGKKQRAFVKPLILLGNVLYRHQIGAGLIYKDLTIVVKISTCRSLVRQGRYPFIQIVLEFRPSVVSDVTGFQIAIDQRSIAKQLLY